MHSQVPKVSVVIPMFNAQETIEDCLDHVFSSQREDLEVIVVDDGSTDDTLAKAVRYPCRVLENETNRGAASARNKGIEASTGQLILFIDSDVLIPRDLLTRIWTFFQNHPNVAILQGSYDHNPYYQNLLSQYKHYVFAFRGASPGSAYVNYIHTACAAGRREVFQNLRFDENLRRREDIESGLRATQKGYLIYADPSFNVAHKKRYTLVSYSKYQFTAAKELIMQHWLMKNRNFTEEFHSGKQPFYKKAWLLRPVLTFLAILSFMLFAITMDFSWALLLAGLAILSFFLELPFRLYLIRRAPLLVSLGAWWLYFFDGLFVGLGVCMGMFTVLRSRIGIRAV